MNLAGPRRSAFTLIELLVVIGIISVLISLLLAAVQHVRDAALRVKCANNLRQLGLAALQYHDGQGSFPVGLEYQSGSNPMPLSSWLTRLLPYVEQGNLSAVTQTAYGQSLSPFQNPPHVGLATVVRLFACPADQRAAQVQFAPRDKFNVAFTCYLGVEGKDLSTNDGLLFRDSHVRITDIEDGSSRTLLVGERPPSTDFQYGWWYAGAGQNYTGSADMVLGVQEQNVLPVTSGSCAPGTYSFAPGSLSNQCDMFHFWSLHSGGANFLFADGAVRFLRYEAAALLPALASRSGGETAEVPN
jgi:prepilin-type N-terminal cleavage/methylation domain-containing protein/prepilin-type processing-associated H-X9-DG protein